MAIFNFNTADIPQDDMPRSFEPLPAGWYSVIVTDTEIKQTKKGTGEMLECTLEVLDGEHRGRKLWARINVANRSAEAERIGRQQLAQLCHAVGITQLRDTNELHGKPLRVKVAVRTSEEYGASNDCKAFEPLPGQKPAAVPTSGKLPWEK